MTAHGNTYDRGRTDALDRIAANVDSPVRAAAIPILQSDQRTLHFSHRPPSGELTQEDAATPVPLAQHDLPLIARGSGESASPVCAQQGGESKYGFLGLVYELKDFTPPTSDTLRRLQSIIDEAFGRRSQTGGTAA